MKDEEIKKEKQRGEKEQGEREQEKELVSMYLIDFIFTVMIVFLCGFNWLAAMLHSLYFK